MKEEEARFYVLWFLSFVALNGLALMKNNWSFIVMMEFILLSFLVTWGIQWLTKKKSPSFKMG